MPNAGFGLNDLNGSAATAGTELGPIVSPYSTQIDGAAAGFTTTAMNTWQGTQQPTSDPQFTTVASPGAGDSATTSGDSGTTDPWMASFFDNDQTSTTGSTANSSETTDQQSANDDDAATETAEGDASLPEPTVSGGFTTTTTVNGDATTTTYTLTSSISLESGSMAGGDANDNSRWDIPTDWIDTASTIPEESDASESDDSENGDGDANVTSDAETNAAPTDESGVRFKASATITVSVTTGPYTAPDGSTGTSTSITFGATGSVVIMVSGSSSTGDEGNTGTVLTGNDAGAAGPATLPSVAESTMTRAPRELILGGNGTSVTASGESFWYAYATIGFSVTISNTTMDNGAAGGGPSAPTASLNLSLGSGSFSTDQSDITVQESSESGSGSNAKSVQVKEKNVSGSATSFALNLGSDDDAGDDATGEGDAGSSDAPSPSPISAAPAFTSAGGNADAADSSGGTTDEDDGPVSFSRSSFNRHQKTTLYGTQSSQQSASSQSSSSTNADIEDASSGSTSLSFSINGFDYETTAKSKSEFSYLSESQSSSDSPVGYDGRPSTHSEATSSHVIETLEESERTFGFGFGSEGFDVTNEYSSNDTVSDVMKSESTSGSWRLVYPTITSSLAMMTNPQSTAPYWVAGPELEITTGHNIQFNYGGNLEDGFEGSYSKTAGYSSEFLKQDGTVGRSEYTLAIQETFPNTNLTDASNSDANSAGGSNTGESGSGDYVFTVAPAATSTPQWHHLFPQKWLEEFAAMGINIHDAKWGWLMDPADHGKLTPAWTEHWDSFFDGPGDRTQAEAIEHLAEGFNRQAFLPIYNKGAKLTLGFHPWNGLDASVKTAKFKALQKALKVLTVAFTTFGAFDDSKSVFAGVLKLNNEVAQQEFADAIDGLIKHQEDPNGGHLDSALTALFGDVMARADMSSVSRINPAGVITKLLAGQVEADPKSLNPAMSAFNEIQEYINSPAN